MEVYRIHPETAVYYLTYSVVEYSEAIQMERFWRQKLDDLHDNPRRKGLVRHPQDWR